MTKTSFADSGALMSPRTVKYVEALIREGDNFDCQKWLQQVRDEEAEAKQAFIASGEHPAVEIATPSSTSNFQAVFAIVEHYRTRRRTNKLLRHAFKFAAQPFDKNADPFTAVIRCTCGGVADDKTISKWARALRYVSRCRKSDTALRTFMKIAGGVNACADQYADLKRRRNRRK
jgi:hypothetical protein